jgi:hypothetical protein
MSFTNLQQLKDTLAQTVQVQNGEAAMPDDVMLGILADAFNLKHEEQVMQLAAISTAAGANTPQSAREQTIYRDNPSWTPAYQDVLDAVRREMKLRRELAELTPILSNQEILMVRNALNEGGLEIDRLRSRLEVADAKVSVLDVFAAQSKVIGDLMAHRGGSACMSVEPRHEMHLAVNSIDRASEEWKRRGTWEKEVNAA